VTILPPSPAERPPGRKGPGIRAASLAAIAIVATVVLVGWWVMRSLLGAGNPRPDAAIGLRPAPEASAATWLGLRWSDVTFESPDAESPNVFEQMVGVAGDATGFVAIGSSSGPAGSHARMWQSADGTAWRLIESPSLDGLELVDIAVRDGTFLAIGSTPGGDPGAYSTSLLVSRDGISWAKAEMIFGAYATGVAAGPPGFAAVLSAVEDEALLDLLLSPDGTSWTRVSGSDVAPGARIRDIAWGSGGWLAVGSVGNRAGVWRSVDGHAWTEDALPAAGPVEGIMDVAAYRVVPGRWATLVLGLDRAPSCAEDDDWCGKYQAAWSWTEGTGWARLGASNWLLQRGYGVEAHAAGDAGFLYLLGDEARTSVDGWDWAPLSATAVQTASPAPDAWPTDVVVLGDQVVGVGTLASAPQLAAWFGSARAIR
jgi:hypothetical protein